MKQTVKGTEQLNADCTGAITYTIVVPGFQTRQ